jgi:hypothetical protein
MADERKLAAISVKVSDASIATVRKCLLPGNTNQNGMVLRFLN